MSFSLRYGYKTARESIQIEGMDQPLRNGLWSLLELHVWRSVRQSGEVYIGYYISERSNPEHYKLALRLWLHYFKEPVDHLSLEWEPVLKKLKRYFFEAQWFEVYDFIEFVAANFERVGFRSRFEAACNARLESEMSAYRFAGGVITRITEALEVEQIDSAVDAATGPVQVHLRRALQLLSDRQAPDYRNSIKEAISSIESLVMLETGSESGTLGQLLKRLDDSTKLHPAMKAAFGNLYGYTSDADGIRHALLDRETLTFEDAKFFLVVCSAFVSFVLSRR
jgi:hypothetical protein